MLDCFFICVFCTPALNKLRFCFNLWDAHHEFRLYTAVGLCPGHARGGTEQWACDWFPALTGSQFGGYQLVVRSQIANVSPPSASSSSTLYSSRRLLTPSLFWKNWKAGYSAPLNSFSWSQLHPSPLFASSIDTTCTIWDISPLDSITQPITHDWEVYTGMWMMIWLSKLPMMLYRMDISPWPTNPMQILITWRTSCSTLNLMWVMLRCFSYGTIHNYTN